ncbi:MAG: hypothetical protein K6G40_03750 [Eubacterium sp.]|nr:hypothetical protein [Eubacterium sp.]
MLYKLERKIGRYAIRNLTKYIIMLYAFDYVLYITGIFANIGPYFVFDPRLVMAGQIWRLVAWILVPPVTSGPLMTMLMLFIFWQFGTMLEQSWGTFRYNFFIFNGLIVTVVLSFVVVYGAMLFGISVPYFSYMNTYYITLSTFLAVAACYPEMEVRLCFIIPIKFKWAALIDLAFMAWDLFNGIKYGAVFMIVSIVASLINLVIMLYLLRIGNVNPKNAYKQAKRKMEWKAGVNSSANRVNKSSSGKITKHKCAICGRTELDGDDLQFRFCSKCNGNYEYCQDHLFTHIHK